MNNDGTSFETKLILKLLQSFYHGMALFTQDIIIYRSYMPVKLNRCKTIKLDSSWRAPSSFFHCFSSTMIHGYFKTSNVSCRIVSYTKLFMSKIRLYHIH